MSGKKNKKVKQKKPLSPLPAGAGKKVASKSSLLLPGLIVAAFAFLLYANTLGHEYTLDDSSVLKDNWVVKKGIAGIPTIFTTHYRYGYWTAEGTLYRPVALSLFALEWTIAPDAPGFYHLINVLLYMLTGLLLLIVLSRIWKGYNSLLPFIVALLFIAHPVHTEIVANIKSADEILAFLFTLLSIYYLWNFLEGRKRSQLIISILFYGLALFSKESVVTFLAVFPLLIWLFRKKKISEIVPLSALYLIPVILLLAMRVKVLGSVTAGTEAVSRLDNLLAVAPDFLSEKATAFLLMGKYLMTLLFPYPLSHEFGYNQIPVVGLGNWKAILSLIVYLLMGIYALTHLNKKRLITFGILFYLITFSLFSNLFTLIGSSYGERFLYIPSLGFVIVLSVFLLKISGLDLKQAKKGNLLQQLKSSPVLMGSLGALLLFYSFITINRNPAWKDSYTLYSTDVKTAPNSAKLRYHHGLELAKLAKVTTGAEHQRLSEAALREFDVAISIHPPYHDAFAEKGLVLYRLGKKELAIQNYETSLKHNPANAKVYSNMGIIYIEQQNYQKAMEVYTKAVELDGKMVDARRNLGVCYALLKQFDPAIVQFKEGLKYADPKDRALLNFYLGSAHRDKGDPDGAKPYFDEAYRLNPALKKN